MDWKKLRSDATLWADKAAGKAKVLAKQAVETSKEYAEKAKVGSYDTLVHGSTTGLATVEDYEAIKDTKRLILFFIDSTEPITKKLLLLFPIVFTKVWIESGTVKVVEKEGSDELRDLLEVPNTPMVLVFNNGECTNRVEDEVRIVELMKNFSFYTE